MSSAINRDKASFAIEKMIQEVSMPKSEFVSKLVFSGKDPSFSEQFVLKRELVGRMLNWSVPGNRKIPDEKIIPFIVEVAGTEILMLSGIRELIGVYLFENHHEDFVKLIEEFCEDSQPITMASFKSIRLTYNGNFAKELCRLSGIPENYSSKGTKISTETNVLVNMPSPLPNLVDYQKDIVERLNMVLSQENGRSILCMPTGSGKTRTTSDAIIGYALENFQWPFSILWVADQSELCEQAFQTLISVFQDYGIREINRYEESRSLDYWRYFGGKNIDSIIAQRGPQVPGITVTSVQQFRKRNEKNEKEALALINNSDLIIVDEAHRNLDWLEKFDAILRNGNSKPPMIGLTATPMRSETLETARLSNIFQQILCPIPGGESDIQMMTDVMIDWGILSKRIERNYLEMFEQAENDMDAIAQIIESLIGTGHKSILVFAESVEEARNLCTVLRMGSSNIQSEYLESSTPMNSRKRILEDFKSGTVNVLLNYGILTTGFDAPNTDAILVCRKGLDQNSSLFIQMVGRGLRGKQFGGTEECTIIHFKGI